MSKCSMIFCIGRIPKTIPIRRIFMFILIGQPCRLPICFSGFSQILVDSHSCFSHNLIHVNIYTFRHIMVPEFLCPHITTHQLLLAMLPIHICGAHHRYCLVLDTVKSIQIICNLLMHSGIILVYCLITC